jgi:pyruvate dehydrogenase (quinone)
LLRSAWQRALASDRPGVLEVKTDPDVVPLPPHVTLKEARGFLSSIAKGDAGSGRVIAETASQVLNAFIGKKE